MVGLTANELSSLMIYNYRAWFNIKTKGLITTHQTCFVLKIPVGEQNLKEMSANDKAGMHNKP